MTTLIGEAIDREAKRRAMATAFAKHPGGGHDQLTHGSWARGASSADVKEETDVEGGLTVNPATGERPSRGFAVAMPGKGVQIPKARATRERIREFISDNWDTLKRQGHFLGTWRDDSKGVVWLDVTRVIDSDNYAQAFDSAVKFGRQHNEVAIYDILSGAEIVLNDDDAVEEYRARLAA